MSRLAPRPRRSRGFTLIEVAVTAAILAIAALTLTAALASNQKMNSLARERTIATSALRAFVEYMRQQYPSRGSFNPTTGNIDMTALTQELLTPADFLPGGGHYAGSLVDPNNPNGANIVEVSALRDARGLVLWVSDETGTRWGPGAASQPGTPATAATPLAAWIWTDATMQNATASINTSTLGPTSAEKAALGLPRDLDGNGTTDNSPAAAGYSNGVDVRKQLFVPAQITLSWLSGSSGSNTAGDATSARQRITIYAAFGPQH